MTRNILSAIALVTTLTACENNSQPESSVDLSEIYDRIEALEAENDQLRAQVEANTATNSTQTVMINGLDTDLETLDSSVSELSVDVADHGEDILGLQSDLWTLDLTVEEVITNVVINLQSIMDMEDDVNGMLTYNMMTTHARIDDLEEDMLTRLDSLDEGFYANIQDLWSAVDDLDDRLGECACDGDTTTDFVGFSLDPLSPSGVQYPGLTELLRFNVEIDSDQDYWLESITVSRNVDGPLTDWTINMDYQVTGGYYADGEQVSVGTVDDYGVIMIGEWVCSDNCEDTFRLRFDTSQARNDTTIAMTVTSITLVDEEGYRFTIRDTSGLPIQGQPIFF